MPIGAVIVLALLSQAGCVAQETTAAGERGGGAIQPLAEAMRDGAGGAGAIEMQDNGLQVLEWIVTDDVTRIAPAMTALAEPAPIDDSVQVALRDNGFRFYRIRQDDLDRLRRMIGGTAFDQQWWYGQVFDWRPLHQRSLRNASRAVAIDGHVRRFSDGAFEILVRSWTLLTEDGPRLQLELVPFFRPEAALAGSASLFSSGRSQHTGEAFSAMAIGHALEPGWAYLLTGESPSIAWQDVSPNDEPTKADRRRPESRGGAEVRGGVGPIDDLGPDILGPVTPGELLLRGDESATVRGMIVLIPHLPARLFPPDLLHSSGADERAERNPRGQGGANP